LLFFVFCFFFPHFCLEGKVFVFFEKKKKKKKNDSKVEVGGVSKRKSKMGLASPQGIQSLVLPYKPFIEQYRALRCLSGLGVRERALSLWTAS